MMAKLILFDIDGTLVLTGGAGLRAMNRAFERTFDVVGAFEGVEMPGRTDQTIISDALSHAGLRPGPKKLARFRDTYCAYLREEILKPGPRKGVMPGVRPLLESLSTRADVHLALLNGNFAESARIKLEHFALWDYFLCGAYGDDAADRNHLIPIALKRVDEHGVPPVALRDVLVVGDTPRDVECARTTGARSVAVATGHFDTSDLRAAGAEVVLETLETIEEFLVMLEPTPRVSSFGSRRHALLRDEAP